MAGERFSRSSRLARFWRHSELVPDSSARYFDQAAFDRIEAAIAAGERRHRGEICFVLESKLSWHALRRGISPNMRALQVFGERRIWDTEENTGILIYLLTADRAVEIIADRLVHRRLAADLWSRACQCIVDAGSPPAGNPVDGVVAAIELLNQALIEALPARAGVANPNELDDRPVRL